MNQSALIALFLGWSGLLILLSCNGLDSGSLEMNGESLENGTFFADLNGFRIHYEIHGSGPVLMVIPNSWGITVQALRGIYGGLEKRLTLVYFDPRGMGESDPIREESDMSMGAVRLDFNALRLHLGLRKTHAIGWSNGAVNLIQLASEYQENLSSAVFLHGTASFLEEDMEEFARQYPVIMERYQEFDQQMNDESLTDPAKDKILNKFWMEELFPPSFADPAKAPEWLKEIFGDMRFSWKHARYSNQENPVIDFRNRLSEIKIPCMVIAGRHDTIPVSKAEEMVELLSDSRMVLLEKSGHFAPLEAPEAFENAVFSFLGVW